MKKVRIDKCTKGFWYEDIIGKELYVLQHDDTLIYGMYYIIAPVFNEYPPSNKYNPDYAKGCFLLNGDCTVIEEKVDVRRRLRQS